MAIKTTIRFGGGVGATVHDYTDVLAVFDEDGAPLLDVGMMCGDGSSCQYQHILDDDLGEIPTPGVKQVAAHNVVTTTEDAPGYEAWLGRGRVASKEVYRGDVAYGDAVQWKVTIDDGNTDLKLMPLTSAWVRPEESGRARVLALLAAFCNGSPRLTTVIATHLVAAGGEVTMPAKTYPAGTFLPEILDDCKGVEGKTYSVVIHHDAGASHLCFLYIDEQDHTTYLSTLTITDDGPDHVTEFPPIWDQGAAAVHEGQEQLTGLVSRYGSGEDSFVFVEDPADIDLYDYAVDVYNDDISVTEAQATSRANAIRQTHSMERVTHQVTIKIPASMVDLLCAGMSIPIRSAASMGGQYLGTTQTRRIAQLKWEPIAPEVGAEEGWYYAHMQLDRPKQLLAERRPKPGPKPPTPGDAPTVLADWTWSDAAGGGDWLQPVAAQAAISQAAFDMDNGHLNGDPWYRTQASGGHIPTEGITRRYLPCTAGVPITLDLDVAERSFNAGNTVHLVVRYYNSIASTTGMPGEDDDIVNGVGFGVWTNVGGTFTPPVGAVKFAIAALGAVVMDNVLITTGGGDSTPPGLSDEEIGDDSGHYADATHKHKHGSLLDLNIPTDHPFFTEHAADPDAHLQHNLAATAAPTATDDDDAGYQVGSLWFDTTNDNIYGCTDASTGAANWEHLNPTATSGTVDVSESDGSPAPTAVDTIEFDSGDFAVNISGTTAEITSLGGGGGSAANITGTYDIEGDGSPSYTDAGMSDEFSSGTLDAQWTVEGAVSGTVSLLTANPADSVYDLATRSGDLLIQVKPADRVGLRIDAVPADGQSIVVAMTPPYSGDAAQVGNGWWPGISVNTDDTSWMAGTARALVVDGGDHSGILQVTNALAVPAQLSDDAGAMGRRSYFRISRSSNVFYFFWSGDGVAWSPVGSVATTGYTNFWIGVDSRGTAFDQAPIVAIHWVRHVASVALDLW